MRYEHIYARDLERDYSRQLMDSMLWDSLVRIIDVERTEEATCK